MPNKKQITVTLTTVGVAPLIAMAIGEALPKPTDILLVWMWDWLFVYKDVIDPFVVQLMRYWSLYFLAAIWYLFLAAVMLHFETGQRTQKHAKAFMSLLVFSGFGVLIGSWLQVTPLSSPIGQETGWIIFLGSIAAAVLIVGYIFYRLREVQVRFR